MSDNRQETFEYSSFVPVKGGAGSILLPLPCLVRSDNEQTRLKPPFDDWLLELLCWSCTIDVGSALGGRLTGVENP